MEIWKKGNLEKQKFEKINIGKNGKMEVWKNGNL